MRVISFDIDGTLLLGSPPGEISALMVRNAREQGHIIGSASDRPIATQVQLWRDLGVEPDFVVLKHQLESVRLRYGAAEYWHVGDGEVDQFYAKQAGFRYLSPTEYLEMYALQQDVTEE